MKIIVTGANGQLGEELKILSKKFPFWNFLYSDIDTLDITDEQAVENYFKQEIPDFVINCAAYTAVDKAETDKEIAVLVNEIAPAIIAKYAKENGAKFIHISTDYVFDGNASYPYNEQEEVNPQSVYGNTKLNGEQNCIKENPDSIIIRTSWLYSVFGNNFVKTMLRLGKERDTLNVVFDQIGTPTNAADLADSILSIVEKTENNKKLFVSGIYHYSNEGVASWYDFAKAIFEISNTNCNVLPVRSDEFPTPAKRPLYSVLDKAKIKNTFEITIPYWKDSLKKCLQKLS